MKIKEEIRRLKEEERVYREEGDLERAGLRQGGANTLIAMLWKNKEAR